MSAGVGQLAWVARFALRENWGQFFDKVLGVAKASIDACESHKGYFVEVSQPFHAEVSDFFGGYFSLVVIENMSFDLDCHLLDIFGLDFAFPASLS
jgi:hypothetical protein